jgi:hypothetical protein
MEIFPTGYVAKKGKSTESTSFYVLILQVDGVEIDPSITHGRDWKRADKRTVESMGLSSVY